MWLFILFCFSAFNVQGSICETGDQHSRFESWMKDVGIEMSPNVRLARDGNRGIFANKNLPAGTIFARIPMSAMINVEHALVDSEVGPILGPNEWISDPLAVAFYLYSLSKRCHPYVIWLPDKVVDSPVMSWSEEELSWLQEGTTAEIVREQRMMLKELWRRMFAVVADKDFTLERFFWSLSMLQSRIHGIDVRDKNGVWQRAKCMVPLADAMNSGPSQSINADCVTDESSTFLECSVTKAVGKGSELLATYGRHSNARLLMDYGFTLDMTFNSEPVPVRVGSRTITDESSVANKEGVADLDVEKLRETLAAYTSSIQEDLELLQTLSRQINAVRVRLGEKQTVLRAIEVIEKKCATS